MSQQFLICDVDHCLLELSAAKTAEVELSFHDQDEGVRRVYAFNSFSADRPEDRKTLLDYLAAVNYCTRAETLKWDEEKALGRVVRYTISELGEEIATKIREQGGPDWNSGETISFLGSGTSYRDGIEEQPVRLRWGSSEPVRA